jgi:hypothetical protein
MGGHPCSAVVLDPHRPTARRLARVLHCAGYEVDVPEEPALYAPQAAAPRFILCAAALLSPVLAALRERPGPAVVPYGAADELDLAACLDEAAVLGALGLRPGQGQGGRLDLEAEVLSLARYLRGTPLPPLQAHLLWGAQAFATEIRDITSRDAAVAHVVGLCSGPLRSGKRVADAAGEVLHELLTNAMYDAPIDVEGRPRYAQDRTAPIELPPRDQVVFRFGSDGLRLALEVEDRFGRLTRADLRRSLLQGASGQVRREAGGAGIGLSLVCRACPILQIDVEPGVRTRITALLDLEPQRGPRPEDSKPGTGSSPGAGAGPGPGTNPGRSLVFPPPSSLSSQGAA